MIQYQTFELNFTAPEPESSHVAVDLTAVFTHDAETVKVAGFYAGGNQYKIRFLPQRAGTWHWQVAGMIQASGDEDCSEAIGGRGLVRASGTHFAYDDSTRYQPFGTTVYALLHQDQALVDQTMASLAASPFNKVRLCVFPKHYDYNHNEPEFYAFQKSTNGWDVNKPCFEFWDHLERRIRELGDHGIEADLIIFHPYDRWGFAKLSEDECQTYLDYLTRRLSAFPNVWWSLANEYDLMNDFEFDWWPKFAAYIHDHDPYGHLLSNHNFIRYWDFANEHTTHCCIQDRTVEEVPLWLRRHDKPVVYDECCYEGNLPHSWGNISAFEMVNRFWKVCVNGGYCTHGETYLNPEEIVWWSRGGRLVGESPARIGFLRELLASLPGPLDPWQASGGLNLDMVRELVASGRAHEIENPFFLALARLDEDELQRLSKLISSIAGHCGEDVFLIYYERQCASQGTLALPEGKNYKVEVIDVWAMTRWTALEHASGTVTVELPGQEGIALLATRVG